MEEFVFGFDCFFLSVQVWFGFVIWCCGCFGIFDIIVVDAVVILVV